MGFRLSRYFSEDGPPSVFLAGHVRRRRRRTPQCRVHQRQYPTLNALCLLADGTIIFVPSVPRAQAQEHWQALVGGYAEQVGESHLDGALTRTESKRFTVYVNARSLVPNAYAQHHALKRQADGTTLSGEVVLLGQERGKFAVDLPLLL